MNQSLVPSQIDLVPEPTQMLNPTQLENLALEYLQQSLSKSTRNLYEKDFQLFSSWCSVRELIALPATHHAVMLFLSAQAQEKGIKAATLVRRLAAIKMFHESQGFMSPTQHQGVKSVLKGIKRNQCTAPRKKAPATAERIASMIAHCPTTVRGLRDKALILLGFAGAFRRSELVALRVDDIERTPEGIKITIRKSKTDQDGLGQVIAIPNGIRFRIVDALFAWLEAANIKEGFVFRSIKKGGYIQEAALTDQNVAKLVKHYAGKAGLTVSDFSGHSRDLDLLRQAL